MKHLKELRKQIKKQISVYNNHIDSRHGDLEILSDDGIDTMHTDDKIVLDIFKALNRPSNSFLGVDLISCQLIPNSFINGMYTITVIGDSPKAIARLGQIYLEFYYLPRILKLLVDFQRLIQITQNHLRSFPEPSSS